MVPVMDGSEGDKYESDKDDDGDEDDDNPYIYDDDDDYWEDECTNPHETCG